MFWYFRALRQLLVQSEAKYLIELLNICFIDNTDLVLWLTYCMKKYFLHLGANMSKKWGGGGGVHIFAKRRQLYDLVTCNTSISLPGALYYMDNSGDCVERYRMEGSALALLLNYTSQVLFVVTNEMMVSQFSVSQDGQTTTIIGVSAG